MPHRPPWAWLHRVADVVRVTEPSRGGHFAPFEEPELYAQELRDFFVPIAHPPAEESGTRHDREAETRPPTKGHAMRILILGGTGWLGRQVALAALSAGHDVTCLARGSAVPEAAHLVRADREEASAFGAMIGEWDAVIDLARQPGYVRRAARALEPVAARFVFVSTVSVYADHEPIGADEDAARLPALEADRMRDAEDYGPAKVACEDAVLETFGAHRSVIARAGLIGGPGDPSGRTVYWPWRFARPSAPGGPVLAPDAPDLPTAVIDVRDLADWLVGCAAGEVGVFNAVAPPLPLPAHLAVAREVAGYGGDVVSAPEDWLASQGVNEWSGPRSLPLWLADRTWYGMGARSNARAVNAGLVFRPLALTLADGMAWRLGQPESEPIGAGLTDDQERELLALLPTR